MLKEIVKRTIGHLISLLDLVVPKDRRMLIFGSFGGRYPGGNSKPVFDYLTQTKSHALSCYFFTYKEVKERGYVCMKRVSLRSLWIFLRAKTVVLTHTLWDLGIYKPSRRKYIIRLWHGHSGPKADGWISRRFTEENRRDVERFAPKITKFLVTSRINLYLWAYSLLLHPNQLLPLGFPRNDRLLIEKKDSSVLRRYIPELPDFNRVILYAPTYRTWSPTRYFPFEDFSIKELNKFLEENKLLILLRNHPSEKTPDYNEDRIIRFGSRICQDINEVLAHIDILITDYSSIASDFMLLDRPLVYLPYDYEEFKEREGFIFGNYDIWTPGPKVTTFEEFIRRINDILQGRDDFAEQRRITNRLINEYQSPNSTQKVGDFLIKFLSIKDYQKYTLNIPN